MAASSSSQTATKSGGDDDIALRIYKPYGTDMKFRMSKQTKVVDIQQYIFDNMPNGWNESCPVAIPSNIRLIYMGDTLDEQKSLGEQLKFSFDVANIMYTVRTAPAAISSEEKVKGQKSGNQCTIS